MARATDYQRFLDAFAALSGIDPENLEAVVEQVVDGCRAALILHFTTKRLVLRANVDDDTIQVAVEPTTQRPADGSGSAPTERPWANLIGKSFGWGWITINQQGYCDGVLLSFGGLEPTLLIGVTASTLTIQWLATAETRPGASDADDIRLSAGTGRTPAPRGPAPTAR